MWHLCGTESALKPSGRRDSNPRPTAWEADALPTELRPRGEDSSVSFGPHTAVVDSPRAPTRSRAARGPPRTAPAAQPAAPERPTDRSRGSGRGSTSTTRPPTQPRGNRGADRRSRRADRLRRDGERPQPTDVVNPAGLGRLRRRAQCTRASASSPGTCPGSCKPALDVRRTRAMLSFRTPQGGAFDGVALDVESLRLKSVGLRTTRLLALSRMLRAEAGETPVAAITYPSRGFERHPTWWPGFPWAADDGARRRLDPDDVHGRRLQGLRRDLRLRGALAPPAPGGGRPGRPRPRGGRRREPDDRGRAAGVRRRGHRRGDGHGLEPVRLADDDARGLGRARRGSRRRSASGATGAKHVEQAVDPRDGLEAEPLEDRPRHPARVRDDAPVCRARPPPRPRGDERAVRAASPRVGQRRAAEEDRARAACTTRSRPRPGAVDERRGTWSRRRPRGRSPLGLLGRPRGLGSAERLVLDAAGETSSSTEATRRADVPAAGVASGGPENHPDRDGLVARRRRCRARAAARRDPAACTTRRAPTRRPRGRATRSRARISATRRLDLVLARGGRAGRWRCARLCRSPRKTT